jgi:hypothetical protein
MKSLKKDLGAVIKELKALTKKAERIAKAVDKLEKAKAAVKKKTKAKPKKKAVAKKARRKKAVAKKAPRKKAAKKAPRKKAAKKAPRKKAAGLTATDQVLKIIKRSKKGIDAPSLMKKTGFEERSVRNILYRAFKQKKIKRTGRGSYVVA